MKRADLPSIGSPLAGGFHTGIIRIGGKAHALITSDKSAEFSGCYGEFSDEGKPCRDIADGLANTEKMAAEGSESAKRVRGMTDGGFTDWAIPARDQQELQYRNLKPTEDSNWATFRDGENPSSEPVGTLYDNASPAQTTAEAFKAGGAQAFEPRWYLTSTRDSSDFAFVQAFSGGDQDFNYLDDEILVRPVRTVPLDD